MHQLQFNPTTQENRLSNFKQFIVNKNSCRALGKKENQHDNVSTLIHSLKVFRILIFFRHF